MMLARAAFPSFFLTLAGFILLLLVTLSVPVIKSIYLLHVISGAHGATTANLGVFGTCYAGGSSTILGVPYSGTARCTHAAVGYTLDYSLFGGGANQEATHVVIKGLAGALILNPIAAGLAGISLLFAFLAWFVGSRILEIMTFLTLFLSSLAAWIAFWLDLALVLVARKRIEDYTKGAQTGHIGNALWLALASAIALSAAICLAGCGVFGRYHSEYASNTRRDTPAGAPVPAGEKRYRRRFWQRKPAYQGTY